MSALDRADGDSGGTTAGKRTRGGRILLVEDDFAMRRALAELLIDEGYVVECAANGAEAMMMLDTNPRPALIILDLWMPYMDGLEFRAIQKSLPRLADVPVVVITAGGLPVENVESLGLVHTFFKPLDSARLLGMVQQLVCPLAR